jgi:hypothetical protein
VHERVHELGEAQDRLADLIGHRGVLKEGGRALRSHGTRHQVRIAHKRLPSLDEHARVRAAVLIVLADEIRELW